MYVCICMYVCISIYINVCIYYVCMYVCTDVWKDLIRTPFGVPCALDTESIRVAKYNYYTDYNVF